MFHQVVARKKEVWLASSDCPITPLITYIRNKGAMRTSQIEAIETYLFLKISGGNKPLWQLFCDGFFSDELDVDALHVSQKTRTHLLENRAAVALYQFATQKQGKGELIPAVAEQIRHDAASLDYESIVKQLFYGVEYADYLMSLPMGAGKTFLMAAFIYLDLYFAQNEPDNPAFAHNFLVLIPSGLKSSLGPSLRTIEAFDPTWVIPDPAATHLKRLLNFEVLSAAKSGRKSNKARNPNAQKVNQILPDPFGQVFVVNAEKVILDRLNLSDQMELLEKTEDDKDRFANELRNLIGKIPHLSLLVDEVHHAAKSDIKLRQVINRWHTMGNVTTVLGFSGTPYLRSAEKINVTPDIQFKSTQISNTVYYYPLIDAIQAFLKRPTVQIGRNLSRLEIIRAGIEQFQELYGETVYDGGAIAKVAIYCPNIAALEEEVFPFLVGEMGIDPDEILKFHKGNKQFSQPQGSEAAFRTLDLPLSKKRYILLVHIGKEGWDCRSLTAVILSQKGDSPKNMVLQTSCRCLRQVDRDQDETALIWLNEYNAKLLNNQLKKEQATSIDAINQLSRESTAALIPRHSRVDHLNLPFISFRQLHIEYSTVTIKSDPMTAAKLLELHDDIERFKTDATIKTTTLGNLDEGRLTLIDEIGRTTASFERWIHEIGRESFGTVTAAQLRHHTDPLHAIFADITELDGDGMPVWNELYDRYAINEQVRVAFAVRRELETDKEVIPSTASLLRVENLDAIVPNKNVYPDVDTDDTDKILRFDKGGEIPDVDEHTLRQMYDTVVANMAAQGMGDFVPPFAQFQAQKKHSLPVWMKDRTFHYVPYNFVQSRFELTIMRMMLSVLKDTITDINLELYYNGERGLTEFVIACYEQTSPKRWKYLGRYTTDFLIIERNGENVIEKVLMIETKGAGYSHDPRFVQKRNFIENIFLAENIGGAEYAAFDFLYLEDTGKTADHEATLIRKIKQFFSKA